MNVLRPRLLAIVAWCSAGTNLSGNLSPQLEHLLAHSARRRPVFRGSVSKNDAEPKDSVSAKSGSSNKPSFESFVDHGWSEACPNTWQWHLLHTRDTEILRRIPPTPEELLHNEESEDGQHHDRADQAQLASPQLTSNSSTSPPKRRTGNNNCRNRRKKWKKSWNNTINISRHHSFPQITGSTLPPSIFQSLDVFTEEQLKFCNLRWKNVQILQSPQDLVLFENVITGLLEEYGERMEKWEKEWEKRSKRKRSFRDKQITNAVGKSKKSLSPPKFYIVEVGTYRGGLSWFFARLFSEYERENDNLRPQKNTHQNTHQNANPASSPLRVLTIDTFPVPDNHYNIDNHDYCPVCWGCRRSWETKEWKNHVLFFEGNALYGKKWMVEEMQGGNDYVMEGEPESRLESEGESESRLESRPTVVVTLDGQHTYDSTLVELHEYAPLVSVGGYLVIQDAKIDFIYNRGGPYTAAIKLLQDERGDWQLLDSESDSVFGYTQHVWLKRINDKKRGKLTHGFVVDSDFCPGEESERGEEGTEEEEELEEDRNEGETSNAHTHNMRGAHTRNNIDKNNNNINAHESLHHHNPQPGHQPPDSLLDLSDTNRGPFELVNNHAEICVTQELLPALDERTIQTFGGIDLLSTISVKEVRDVANQSTCETICLREKECNFVWFVCPGCSDASNGRGGGESSGGDSRLSGGKDNSEGDPGTDSGSDAAPPETGICFMTEKCVALLQLPREHVGNVLLLKKL